MNGLVGGGGRCCSEGFSFRDCKVRETQDWWSVKRMQGGNKPGFEISCTYVYVYTYMYICTLLIGGISD